MPRIFLRDTDIPYVKTKTHIVVQKADLTTDLTLRLWNLYILKICLRSIIVPIDNEFIPILETIASYLGVYIDFGSLTVKRMGNEYESRRSIGT